MLTQNNDIKYFISKYLNINDYNFCLVILLISSANIVPETRIIDISYINKANLINSKVSVKFFINFDTKFNALNEIAILYKTFISERALPMIG